MSAVVVDEDLLASLRSGEAVDDRTFDLVFPPVARLLSSIHWTPLEAAVQAARLLADRPGARILDVGSGVGKFCIVAAATVEARVVGVEHRPHLVRIAERAAARIGVDVRFRVGTLADCDASEVDGLYLFNPFAENLCSSEDRIDETVELGRRRYLRDVAEAEDFLRRVRDGTRVVTYCSFGGELPDGYVCLVKDRRPGSLELWVKSRESAVAPPVSETRLGARGRSGAP